MPPAPPTCAARIIRNEPLKNGWGIALNGDTNQMVNSVKKYAKDCYVLQIDRTRAVDASSLSSAVFWEHRHLPQPLLVSTPAADYRSLFCTDKKKFLENIEKIEQHPMFGPMREREFTVWPIQVPQSKSASDDELSHWVTIVMRVQPAAQGSGSSIDRVVTDFAIVDPFLKKREPRGKWIEKKLTSVLAQGGIDFSDAAKRHEILTEDVVDKWATGYVSYAICREFLRRLKVLTRRRDRDGFQNVPVDFLWEDFEEYFNLDTYRESLMAACAHQTIEKSKYRVRMAIDVPSVPSDPKDEKKAANYHDSRLLMHPNAENDVPDEDYSHAFKRLRQIPIKEQSDSDDSDAGKSRSSKSDGSGSDSSKSVPSESESDSDVSDLDVSKPASEGSVQAKPTSTSTHSEDSASRSLSPTPSVPSVEDADMGLPDYEDECATDGHSIDTEMVDASTLRLSSVDPVSTEQAERILPVSGNQTIIESVAVSRTTSVVDFANENETERPQKHFLEDAAEGSTSPKKPKTVEDGHSQNDMEGLVEGAEVPNEGFIAPEAPM
ncbi:hypothetical protein GGR53DRAFT_529345 [Hypoxylon sp. FL1150]|nr:hypothetical protein GGR53DRAFT_529345 [Hypoxylon sp. FL1150]